MSTYLLMINEEQRKALHDILKRVEQEIEPDVTSEEGDIIEHPLKYWIDMLNDLPNEDQYFINATTGKREQITNGFCL